jgi:hypothetical protein
MIPPSVYEAERMIAAAETPGERIEIATGLLQASLGSLCALVGRQTATELCYRHADALATMGER